MPFTLATWNINSVRLREDIVARLMREEAPDVLCLQECKSPVDKIPLEQFQALGYHHMVARGQKGYNGVAIFSKIPMVEAGAEDYANLGHARHIAGKLENGVTIHNHYIPAGGDVAGDLNIAPREDDVWDHKKLLKVVSHTPIEVDHFNEVMEAGAWSDVTRNDITDGKLYSWWSYRAKDWDAADKGRRLDHIWATPDIKNAGHSSRVMRDARGCEKPSDHAPVFASFDL